MEQVKFTPKEASEFLEGREETLFDDLRVGWTKERPRIADEWIAAIRALCPEGTYDHECCCAACTLEAKYWLWKATPTDEYDEDADVDLWEKYCHPGMGAVEYIEASEWVEENEEYEKGLPEIFARSEIPYPSKGEGWSDDMILTVALGFASDLVGERIAKSTIEDYNALLTRDPNEVVHITRHQHLTTEEEIQNLEECFEVIEERKRRPIEPGEERAVIDWFRQEERGCKKPWDISTGPSTTPLLETEEDSE